MKKKQTFFSKLPLKRCQGGCCLHCQLPQSVFEEDKAEEAAEKKIKKDKKNQKNQKKKNQIIQFFF